MNKKLNSVIAALLAVVLLLSALPIATASATTAMTITVSTKNAMAGQTVDIDVMITDNPGVAAISLDVEYDKANLELQGFVYNEEALAGASTTPYNESASIPCLFMVNGTQNITGDFKFATLTFKVKDNALSNTVAPIRLTYDPDNIYDIAEDNIDCTVVNGAINIIACIPGDINGDEKVNSKDVSRLMQYHAHWDVEVNEPALDTNGDEKLNSKDVTRLMQYLAHWDVELYPILPDPITNLSAVAAVAAACETEGNIAYWYNEETGKYYKDSKGLIEISQASTVIPATGHTVVIDPAVEPGYDHEGLTEGSHCSVCGKIIVPQEPIPPLTEEAYNITYHLYADDAYLQSVGVTNPNPATYTSQKGLKLQNIRAEGYIFEGWYDGEGANGELVKTIPVGSEGDIELYAKWTEREYTINFDSPDVPIASITYSVSKGATLTNAKCYGYTFVGWSNDDGFIVSKIKPGTTGNLTLHANWTSNRNRATGFTNYSDPIIIEDNETGQFLFVYDIGRIDNVPLAQIDYIGNSDGINIDNEYQVVNSIEKQNAQRVSDIVSNTTTRSSGWTLSNEWNKIYESGNETDETKGKSTVRTDSAGSTVGGNYFVSNSKGGASYLSTDSGGSWSNSARVTTEKSTGINTSYDQSSEMYCDVKLGVKNEIEFNAGVSLPIDIVEVSAGVKNTTTVSAEVANGRRDTQAYHVDTSQSSYVGTDRQSSQSGYYNVSSSQSSNWNSTEGYEKSYQESRSTEVSNAINEQITKKTTYNMTDSLSGANSTHEEVGGTEGRENEYSTSLQYSEGDATTKTQRITFKSNEPGYYRLVNAGTVHVFGVVGYDVATSSYYTYTYSVLDDERHTYLDYSKERATFDDCENGVVPFEIPFSVTEYVTALTTKSDDLEFGLDGKVNQYDGVEEDAAVILPQYYSAKNGADGSYSAVKITSFNANTFKGNTKIKRVVLPVYITEIPDNAFEGCTNLEEVVAMGVTKIGDNAFKGCTSLGTFKIDNMVTSLGNNAFEGVNEIKVQASKVGVFNAALESGAKKITIGISGMVGSIDNRLLVIDSSKEYFALLSNGTTYSNLQIKSDAAETYISYMNFADNKDTPLVINSNKITLNRVNIDNAPGFAMILKKDHTDIALYDKITFSSATDNAILAKSISLIKENSEVTGSLNTTGDVLICGTVNNDNLLKVTDSNNNTYEIISESEYNRYLTSAVITFDPNGGEEIEDNTKVVYYGQVYGDMPIPEKEHYEFTGWYTAKNGGEHITADMSVTSLVNQTLYAHWTEATFNVSYDANGGEVNSTGKQVTYNSAYGALPVPTREGFEFMGWYLGDTQITADTIAADSQDVTLRARWKSGWKLDSEVPSGAELTGEEKWTYDLTSHRTTSTNTSPGDGWTKEKEPTWVWGEWGPWSGWSRTNPGSPSDNRQLESRTVTDQAAYTSYRYWIYRTPDGYGYGTQNYNTGSHGSCTVYDEININYQLSCTNSSLGLYGSYNSSKFSHSYDDQWFYGESTYHSAVTHTEWRYRDRSKIYTYYWKKVDSLESEASITAGGDISNVKYMVKYILK